MEGDRGRLLCQKRRPSFTEVWDPQGFSHFLMLKAEIQGGGKGVGQRATPKAWDWGRLDLRSDCAGPE